MQDLAQFEADLWEAADNLRANSKLTSSDYFMPVLGVIFLRHAANRFDAATKQIADDQAAGRMPKRKVQPADYIRRRALWLPETARYDYIMEKASVDPAGLPKLVTEAMTAIEADFEPLQGVRPKDYSIFEPKVLEDLRSEKGQRGSCRTAKVGHRGHDRHRGRLRAAPGCPAQRLQHLRAEGPRRPHAPVQQRAGQARHRRRLRPY